MEILLIPLLIHLILNFLLKVSLPLSFIFGNAEGVELYISGVIFDHKPFTKVSVARFTIPNDE